MEIESVSDLADKLADMLGIYGGCKHAVHGDSLCPNEYDSCCRTKFVSKMEDRIRSAVNNEFKDKFIEALKVKWIKEFGNLRGEENERDGYFMVGFVIDIFDNQQ